MPIKPLQDRVLIERVAEETKTASGIIIPDNHTEKPARGKVVAVGPGYLKDDGSFRALEVTVGDTVLFGKFAGTEVKVEGSDYLIMKESDVFGIMA